MLKYMGVYLKIDKEVKAHVLPQKILIFCVNTCRYFIRRSQILSELSWHFYHEKSLKLGV